MNLSVKCFMILIIWYSEVSRRNYVINAVDVTDTLNLNSILNSLGSPKEDTNGKLELCKICKIAIEGVNSILSAGLKQDEIASLISFLCKDLKIASPDVCDGIVNVFQLYSPVLKILHITDIHLDHYYTKGNSIQCGDPLCCQANNNLGSTPENSAGKWGEYENCDVPLVTVESMLDDIGKIHKIDMVYFTGDIPPHIIWKATRPDTLQQIDFVNELFQKRFMNITVYSAVGNHESVPINSFPPPGAPEEFNISWLYEKLADDWTRWLPSSVRKTIKRGGFYSVKVKPGFRVISINSNYCSSYNWWLLLNTTDPAQQLSWLVDELFNAEVAGEKVHIIGHMPPGKYDCIKAWSRNYYKIINRFESTVRGQFFGHWHTDEFELFFDEKNSTRATNIAYLSPSITCNVKVNPSYRIFTIDGNHPKSTRAVLDHETYFLNLTRANSNENEDAQWERGYSAKDLYSLQSLQPEEWNKLVRRMENDQNLFNSFYRNYLARSKYTEEPCVGQCRKKIICDLKSARSNDPSLC